MSEIITDGREFAWPGVISRDAATRQPRERQAI